MKKEQKRKITQLLSYGIAGAVLTMIGDFLLLGVDSTGAEGAISQYLMAAEKISYTRIGLAGFFGTFTSLMPLPSDGTLFMIFFTQ